MAPSASPAVCHASLCQATYPRRAAEPRPSGSVARRRRLVVAGVARRGWRVVTARGRGMAWRRRLVRARRAITAASSVLDHATSPPPRPFNPAGGRCCSVPPKPKPSLARSSGVSTEPYRLAHSTCKQRHLHTVPNPRSNTDHPRSTFLTRLLQFLSQSQASHGTRTSPSRHDTWSRLRQQHPMSHALACRGRTAFRLAPNTWCRNGEADSQWWWGSTGAEQQTAWPDWGTGAGEAATLPASLRTSPRCPP